MGALLRARARAPDMTGQYHAMRVGEKRVREGEVRREGKERGECEKGEGEMRGQKRKGTSGMEGRGLIQPHTSHRPQCASMR